MSSWKTNRRTGTAFRVTSTGDRIEIGSELDEFLSRHIYSYRDVPIGEFARLYKKYPEHQTEIRMKYRSLESGRLLRSMEAFSSFFWNLDRDEMELFASRNPNIVTMMNEYAVVEDLREYV